MEFITIAIAVLVGAVISNYVPAIGGRQKISLRMKKPER
jgi:hypothetical protein